MDDYFTYPANTKWSFDEVGVTVNIPVGTVVYMDKTVERLFRSYYNDDYVTDVDKRFRIMTEDGLEYPDSGKHYYR